MIKKVSLPEGVSARIEGGVLFIKGRLGESRKSVENPLFTASIEGNEVIFKSVKESDTRKYKRVINTYAAHVNNMIKGVLDGYEAKLKVVYSHFPITVKVEGSEILIENFAGEKKPRRTKVLEGAKVKLSGNEVIITGYDKEVVGQTAANLENTAKIKYRDRRVFQDGIWITKKP